jgi:anaerobic ribonucleoside-triphosphate reductase activating protein
MTPDTQVLLSVNKAHYPVTALGPGRRLGLWLQGCRLGCPGCVSQDTWSRVPEHDIAVEEVLRWIEQLGDRLDGVTISGGEPFDQVPGLTELLQGLHRWRQGLARPVDLLAYSGYAYERLQQLHPQTLALLDGVITGPYLRRRPTTLVWRGSANQRFVPLSPLGEQRYGPHLARSTERAVLQAVVDADSIWYVGVPHEGDMERLEEALRARGVVQEEMSWKS